ncbi:squalene--hopene cyclase [Singulisphaera sp. PoT]|uniref:squalene--hopene cyclase n=1 Tax=Singulisphaera sp. PoT TaxID=3411797 RepID=UPI003BF5E042
MMPTVMSVTQVTTRPTSTTGRLDEGISRALSWLVDEQEAAGFWVGMLESNCCMEAEWILAMHVLGIEGDPKLPGVVRAILNQQRSDGAWEVYHGSSGGDINTTVECYAALRVAGEDPNSPALRKALGWILERGGLSHLRNFTKFWLALIGEWPWDQTPTLPPELIYLPSWMPFNIYQFASWARGTILPLAVLSARRTCRPLPPEKRLDELFPEGRENHDFKLARRHSWISWESPFYVADRLLRLYTSFPIKPGRETAVKLCLEWIIKHQESDGAWSGIQPPWIYSLMALREEGYPIEHPVLQAGLEAFNTHWSYERNGGTYLQASESPIWDTALSLLAMLDNGCTIDEYPAAGTALDWLLNQQVFTPGDWQVHAKGVEGGGWAFQRANRFYPDVDDTAVILLILERFKPQFADTKALDFATERATRWLEGMQCANGGWGAFDRDNTHSWLAKIPFADFGELLDPPSVDVTAHVVEAFAAQGRRFDDPVVARAIRFIRSEQEEDGSWFGRWGVNHIYGTAAVLPALREIGVDTNLPWVRKAAGWIVAHQNADGGWGESCASYMDDKLRGVGETTASQTGWALMALLAVDTHDYDDAIRRGVKYLVDHQAEGTWNEPEYTGTGFPGYGVGCRINLGRDAAAIDQDTDLQRAFMINYNLYRHYFPLMALGRARTHFGR